MNLYNAPLKFPEIIHRLQMEGYFLPLNFRCKFGTRNQQIHTFFEENRQRMICLNLHVSRDLRSVSECTECMGFMTVISHTVTRPLKIQAGRWPNITKTKDYLRHTFRTLLGFGGKSRFTTNNARARPLNV